ncbi:MAG: damage-control phosphatase ARMT1 family protein, partial [Brevefilum sp.]|nr:damage-control phosphatase ARMT1 family protein [Brevefilum sp.]
AVQYFQPGPWQGKDPFQHLKDCELLTALPEFIKTFQNKNASNDESAFKEACYQSLWGNQSDLSNLQSYDEILNHPAEKLVIDHSEQAFKFISHHNGKLAYFFDNVGKEIFFDLALIDLLLQRNLAQSVTCYLKSQPFFVSDALPKDLYQAVDLLASSSDEECEHLAARITNDLKSGKIRIEAPPFLATSRTFRAMPDALKREIGQHDLAILKGDVNFRKLVGDRHWDPTTPIEKTAGYFPTSLLSLRTLKGELIVGLEKDQLHNLESNAEENWMINGKRGTITFFQNQN